METAPVIWRARVEKGGARYSQKNYKNAQVLLNQYVKQLKPTQTLYIQIA